MMRFADWIMASSDHHPDEDDGLDIAYIQELVFRCSTLITPMVLAPSAIFNWSIGLHLLSAIEWVLTGLCVTNTYLLIRTNRRLASPLVTLLISLAILIATVLSGVYEAIYWAYAFPVAIYLLVNARQALILNIAWWLVCTLLVAYLLTPLAAASFSGGHISTCIFLHIMFSILSHHEKQLNELTIRDPLTHALNRRAMLECLEDALLSHQRYGVVSSLVMIDIDNFKLINDSFGHREGDQVLVNLVKVLEKRVRSTDRVCRYGGEEFIVLLSNTDREQAYAVADSIRQYVESTHMTVKCKATISCGVAEIRHDDSLAEWIHSADLALYAAKGFGRNQVQLEKRGAVAKDRFKIGPV